MFFQRIKTPGIAHVAYLIGDKGEAALIDPRRDIDEYLQIARENKLTINFVIETHRQEDFVMGSSELARITGAKIVNGRHDLFGHGDIRLKDEEDFSFASFRFKALFTPGHTPESLCYAVFLNDIPDKAWAIFSGDTLFIGETGRTDLTDPKKTGENAGLLFDSIHEKIAPLGDQALLFPAHGAGSVCGGDIAERDSSSLGFERQYNPVFLKSRDEFIAIKIKERIPRPPYFSLMEKLNLKGGIALEKQAKDVKILQPKKFASEKESGIVIDSRSPEAFAGGHIPKSYSIWTDGLPVFGGWVAGATTSVFLVLPRIEDLEEAVLSLARIGIDSIEGVLAGGFESWRNAGLPINNSGTTTPKKLERSRDSVHVLDVRDDSEFEDGGHIPNASHMYVGYLEKHLDDIKPPLDKKEKITVTCGVGHRASFAASVLRRRGFTNVDNLLGGMKAWEKTGRLKQTGKTNTVTTPDVEGART